LGNAGRNSIIGPPLVNFDFSLYKNFPVKSISENFSVQFRAEFFNVLNHANFAPPLPIQDGAKSAMFNQNGTLSGGGGLTTLNGTTTLTRVGGTSNYLLGARNLFTYADDFQLVKGKHQLSFGVWLQRMQDNRNGANRKAGGLTS
jgi:hypothetical protein